MKKPAIVQVENPVVNKVYIATTGDFTKYKDNLVKYQNSKGVPNQWVVEHGIDALNIKVLEELSEDEYKDAGALKSKKKQWTYRQQESFDGIYEVINPFDEIKAQKGKAKIQYNVYDDIKQDLVDIKEQLNRIEEKVNDK